MKPSCLKVIVVDDELPLRQELRSFPWERFGAVLIGEAENGLEALKLCADSAPDVVVTDITMPLMNGMELFEQIKIRFPHIQVILLTCHSDFQYAREALKLGALEYLVKVTLEESDLERALGKAREVIDRNLAHHKSSLEQHRRGQSKVINRLLKDKSLAEETIIAELSRSGLLRELPTRVVVLKVQAHEEDPMFIDQEIQAALAWMESQEAPGFTWVPIRSMEYMIVFQEQNLQANQLKSRMKIIIQGLLQLIDEHLSFLGSEVSVYGVISELVTSGQELVKAFGHMKLWEQAQFYENEAAQTIFIGKPVPLVALDKAQEIELIDQLRQFHKDDDASIKAYLQNDFIRWCQRHRFYPSDLKRMLGNFLTEWSPGIQAPEEELAAVQLSATLGDLVETVIRMIERKIGKRSRVRKEVRDARQYIEDHLEEAVTLHILAEHVALSPHYLSRLFREDVGETVNEFMTRLRMEKAIDLLLNSNLKVYEVADKVGIPSYRYFSTIFRSWTGVAPTDYKKHQAGRSEDEGGFAR
jgi:two-component system response regulator YesN